MAERSVADKAASVLAERRLRLLRGESGPSRRVFEVVSAADPFTRYRVEVTESGWACDCPSHRKCSHVEAAMLWLAVLGGEQ